MTFKNKTAGRNPAALAMQNSITSKNYYTIRGILAIATLVFCMLCLSPKRGRTMKDAHPSNPHYYPWIICDAPDNRLLGRVFRGTDLVNFPSTFIPNGTVFQHRETGELQLFWNGNLSTIYSLDDPISAEEKPLWDIYPKSWAQRNVKN